MFYFDILILLVVEIEWLIGVVFMWELGVLYYLNENYFKWIEVMEFVVKYDDGKDLWGFLEVDVLFFGVFWIFKILLSFFLVNKNLKVVNLLLIFEVYLLK